MKALVYTGPETVVHRDHDDPAPADGEVLIRVAACGICGSDMHAYHGRDPRRVPPLILGHETAGEVIAGPGQGQRVVVNPLITCGRCHDCTTGRSNLCPERRMIGMNRPGAFAELMTMPPQNLIDLPDGMDPAHAALTEPTATVWHGLHLAARHLTRPLVECRALAIGGGAIGLLAGLVLRAWGCREPSVAETNPLRRRTVEQAGLAPFDPTAGDGVPDSAADLVVDAVGTEATRRAAFRAVRPGGTVLHVGLGSADGGFDARKATLQEITFLGCYTYTPADFRASLHGLHAGDLGGLDWAERRPLSEGAAAFAELDEGRAAAAKIVLVPG